jgi:VQ motif
VNNATMPDLTTGNTASSGSGMTGPTSSPPSHANMKAGRVWKSPNPRRRSRASRRAPVTLLNTDTNNFRAMVQQFTGIPSGPYSSGSLPGSSSGSGPTISFGVDFGAPMRPSGGEMSFGQLQPQQYHRQPPFQEQDFSSQQQQQQYQYGNMFTTGEFSSTSNSNNGDNMFIDRYTNDRVFVGNMAGQMMPKVANSATNIRGDGYFG